MKDVASLPVNEVLEALETSRRGLTGKEAQRRFAKYGPNMLLEKKRVPITYKFLAHLKDLFSVLLLFASLLAALGSIWEPSMLGLSFIILAVVLVNTFFSLFQEWQAGKKPWKP